MNLTNTDFLKFKNQIETEEIINLNAINKIHHLIRLETAEIEVENSQLVVIREKLNQLNLTWSTVRPTLTDKYITLVIGGYYTKLKREEIRDSLVIHFNLKPTQFMIKKIYDKVAPFVFQLSVDKLAASKIIENKSIRILTQKMDVTIFCSIKTCTKCAGLNHNSSI